MKRTLLIQMLMCIAVFGIAQLKPSFTDLKKDHSVVKPPYQDDGSVVGSNQMIPMVSTKQLLDDPSLGTSIYDLQTNSGVQNRIYRHPDSAMGGTFTMSNETTGFSDRGTGYNYYNGTSWGPPPSARLENIRTGWPSYRPYGANGELIVAHRSATNPLVISRRDTRGTGAWTQTELAAPAGASGLDWPRTITNGPDHTYIHIIAVTGPTANGGVVYQGLDGAIVYNRSLDGGDTWAGWQILDGMTSTDYLGFDGDTYAWAEPHGDTLVFVVGESWNDQFIMKSTDNGDTWTKTKIWSCPWNLWAGPDTTGIFYCPDGSNAITMDNEGKVHILFGLQRGRGDETGAKFWYPFTDGLIYWNEDMPELPQDLDPNVLFANGNYIGWVQDTMVFYAQIEELAHYYVSLSSHPALVSDEFGNLFAIWDGVMTLRDPNSFMLRHLFARASTDNGVTWRDTIVDLTGDFLYTWSECVYPSASPTSTEKLFILFQEDEEGGVYIKGLDGAQGQTTPTTNSMIVISPEKVDIIVPGVGIPEKPQPELFVSPNYPNPADNISSFTLRLASEMPVQVKIFSVTGQQVKMLTVNPGAGSHEITMQVSELFPGIYFRTVKAGNTAVTHKLIIE